MLVLLALLILLLWGGGLAVHVGGDLIHALLVVALLVFILSYLPTWRGRA